MSDITRPHGGSPAMGRTSLEVLQVQLRRIANNAAEPELARALLSTLDTLTELPFELRSLSTELSDLEPEPEICQKPSCDRWALSGDFFCLYH